MRALKRTRRILFDHKYLLTTSRLMLLTVNEMSGALT